MKIYSWNVNGIRAVKNKGELDNFFKEYNPDFLCIQETKAQENQINELEDYEGYYKYMKSAEKKGYSGVLIYSKTKCEDIEYFEDDLEGRMICLNFESFSLINCYFPNSQAEGKRLDFKLEFNDKILNFMNNKVSEGKNVILCGDLNVAHEEIDLKNPKTNHKNPGFLPEERQWFSKLLENGYVDTFRHFYPDTIKYSWWSYRFKAREKNAG